MSISGELVTLLAKFGQILAIPAEFSAVSADAMREGVILYRAHGGKGRTSALTALTCTEPLPRGRVPVGSPVRDRGSSAARPGSVVLVEVLGSGSSRWCQVKVLGRQKGGGGSKLQGKRSERDPANFSRIAGTFGLSGERITTCRVRAQIST